MGCDIHIFKEKRANGQWVTADEWTCGEDWDGNECMECSTDNYGGRNYNLFGVLSEGVRRNQKICFKQRGIPFDACEEVSRESDKWDGDGHSHSYLYLHELNDLQETCKREKITIEGMMARDQWLRVQEEANKSDPDWSVLYPYCQGTNRNDYVNFSIDVPMTFILGNCLEEIISKFDGIEGDNHRIVFWFDN